MRYVLIAFGLYLLIMAQHGSHYIVNHVPSRGTLSTYRR